MQVIKATLRKFHPALAEKLWRINAHDHQWPPMGDWTTWLIIGGRGAGKTRAGAEWVRSVIAGNDNPHTSQDGAKKCFALVAETYADAREVMIEGPSGICAVAADADRPAYESSRRRLVWPSGAVAYAFSAEDPDGIRGYQFDGAWSDDPKSSESAVPHFSNGNRDDLAQRRALEAQALFWNSSNNNPVSSIYGGSMVDAGRSFVYAYDARPFPDFPSRADIWGDAPNWEKGHWLNGRLGRAPLSLLVAALAREVGFTAIDTSRLQGIVTGYVVDRPMSPREAIDPLAEVYQFDMVEAGTVIRFQPRHGVSIITIDKDMLVSRDNGAFSLVRAQENDLPAGFRLGFFDEQKSFGAAAVEARDPGAAPAREIGRDIAAVIPAAEAAARARSILADAWVMREHYR